MTWRASFSRPTAARRIARFAAGSVLLVVVAGCGASSPTPAASTAPAPPGAEPVEVAKVIDGDTLQLADGRRVRVLGIDSCDARTVGGERARIEAAEQLTNPGSQPITLAREPGVDLDPTGLLLRYVQLNGADYGQRMVPYDHTGASAGPVRMSAGPAYLAIVRALDTRSSDQEPPVARDCGGPAERSSSSTSTTTPSTTASPSTSPSSSPESSSESSSASSSDEPDDSPTVSDRPSGSSDDG